MKLAYLGKATMADATADSASKIGTRIYQAPEVIESNKTSSKGDMWSVGICFLQINLQQMPRQFSSKIKQSAFYNTIENSGCCPDMKNVLWGLL